MIAQSLISLALNSAKSDHQKIVRFIWQVISCRRVMHYLFGWRAVVAQKLRVSVWQFDPRNKSERLECLFRLIKALWDTPACEIGYSRDDAQQRILQKIRRKKMARRLLINMQIVGGRAKFSLRIPRRALPRFPRFRFAARRPVFVSHALNSSMVIIVHPFSFPFRRVHDSLHRIAFAIKSRSCPSNPYFQRN